MSILQKIMAKCRKLWYAKRILLFWVGNGSIKVKLFNDNVSIITHDCDLEKLFPGDPLTADTNKILYRPIGLIFVF